MPTKKEKERAKNQNEEAKKRWDSVSCRLPKGTKDRIQSQGESVNGLINRLVLEWLESQEREPETEPEPEPAPAPPKKKSATPAPTSEPVEELPLFAQGLTL